MTDARLRDLYREAVEARDDRGRDACPTVDDLQALVERRGSEDTRLATLDHALACRACARELELLRALRVASSAGAGWHTTSWARAAAIVIVLIGSAAMLRLVHREQPVMRGVAGNAVHLVPSNGAPVLQWHAVPNAISYQVEVLDPEGTTVASGVTPDTEFSVPAAARDALSARDLWWVRARLRDGTEVRSVTQPFGAPR